MKRTFPLVSDDCSRGFAVLVARSHLFATTARPSWLRHAPDASLIFSILDASRHFFVVNLAHSSQQPGEPACAPSRQRRWPPYDGVWVFYDACIGG
jgi:hypothetical protein